MRLAGYVNESLVDGPGLRFVLFAQGCPHGCLECHNPETWDIGGGSDVSAREILRLIKRNKKHLRGVTFSGGEPFLQAAELVALATSIRQFELDLTIYTGFTYEELISQNNPDVNALLAEGNILIDGKYINSLKAISLPFRGSSNQRVIDLDATRASGTVTLVSGA